MTKHIMLDLETMGSGSNAPIVSIGAVVFDPATGDLGERFYQVVNLNSSAHFGEIDASTVQWWLQQSEDARSIFHKDAEKVNLKDALNNLNEWFSNVGSVKEIFVWGNGSGFDNVILNNAFKSARIRPNFIHWNDLDVRTIVKMGRDILGIDPKSNLHRSGTHHSALDDAIFQAQFVSVIWSTFNNMNRPSNGTVEEPRTGG